MYLKQRLEKDGAWLFRNRGYLPVFLFLLMVPTLVARLRNPNSQEVPIAWTAVCALIALSGQAVRFLTIAHVPKGTSGRNRRAQVAESLNVDGAYSVVRNPLYLGNTLGWLGIAALPASLELFLVIALTCWLYHERIILAEEAFLGQRFGDDYRSWVEKTPAFIPNPRLWRRPAFGFSFRYAFGREFEGLFILTSIFAVLHTLLVSTAERRFDLSPVWAITWVTVLVAFVIVRYLRKHTRLFTVAGRSW